MDVVKGKAAILANQAVARGRVQKCVTVFLCDVLADGETSVQPVRIADVVIDASYMGVVQVGIRLGGIREVVRAIGGGSALRRGPVAGQFLAHRVDAR